MALRFTPERAVYDPRHRWVRFFARDQMRLVPCAVTRKALMAAANMTALDRESPLSLYRTLKKQVQAVASDKYEAHDLEQGGVVVHKWDLLAKTRRGLAARE
jgi:hypothetical protein